MIAAGRGTEQQQTAQHSIATKSAANHFTNYITILSIFYIVLILHQKMVFTTTCRKSTKKCSGQVMACSACRCQRGRAYTSSSIMSTYPPLRSISLIYFVFRPQTYSMFYTLVTWSDNMFEIFHLKEKPK